MCFIFKSLTAGLANSTGIA